MIRSFALASKLSSSIRVASAVQIVRPLTTATPLDKFIDKNVLDEALEYRPSKEYHIYSTRYVSSNRQFLNILQEYWGPQPNHKPKTVSDKIASGICNGLFNVANLYFKKSYIDRAIMLETVASLPGLICCNLHHLRSLRKLRTDEWVKPLIDEAENERMHLLSFMNLKPLRWDKKLVIKIVQFGFVGLYIPLYIFFPRTCHRFVGYLEEHAVHTYDEMIQAIDTNKLKNYPAEQISKDYWGLPQDATLRDVILVIRGDECDHRMVNHSLADEIDNRIQLPGKKWYAGIQFNCDLHSRFGPYMKFPTTEEGTEQKTISN